MGWDYDTGSGVCQEHPLAMNHALAVEQEDEQTHDGQVDLGGIINEGGASHRQCSRVYKSKVRAMPCLRPVSETNPSSRRSFEASHTQPGARSSAYFCRFSKLAWPVNRERICCSRHTAQSTRAGKGQG